MERLTKTISCPDKTKIYDISNELFRAKCSRADKTRMVLEKLAEYEDLEEQGRLIKLLCKIGDTLWYVDDDDDDYPIKLEIDAISREDGKSTWYYANDDVYGKFGFIDSDFGKTVFLTKSEAEAKLKELRGGENESSN